MAVCWRSTVGVTLLAAAIVYPSVSAEAQNTPKRYALVIGLNNFLFLNNSLKPLQFANADAREVAEVLTRYGFDVTPLINVAAKREAIVGELNRLARLVNRDDTFLLFFAGHGVQNPSISDTSTYWLTYDALLDAPDVQGIRLEHLMDYVRDIRANRKLVLLDHCFSGKVSAALHPAASGSLDATQPGGRGGSDTTLTVARGAEPVPGWASVRSRATGLVVLGASRDLAYERDGHGLFTAALLAALRSRAADTDKDGKLTVAELLMFLPQRMQMLATKYQLNQQIEDIVEGKQLGGWELVSALPVDSVAEATSSRQRYNELLNRWMVRNYISAVVRMKVGRLIDKWRRAAEGEAMDLNDRALFEQVRGLLEDRSPEQERGRALAELYDAACTADPEAHAQSELCR